MASSINDKSLAKVVASLAQMKIAFNRLSDAVTQLSQRPSHPQLSALNLSEGSKRKFRDLYTTVNRVTHQEEAVSDTDVVAMKRALTDFIVTVDPHHWFVQQIAAEEAAQSMHGAKRPLNVHGKEVSSSARIAFAETPSDEQDEQIMDSMKENTEFEGEEGGEEGGNI